MMHGGTIVDATVIEAPDSRKNAKRESHPKMHSVKKHLRDRIIVKKTSDGYSVLGGH